MSHRMWKGRGNAKREWKIEGEKRRNVVGGKGLIGVKYGAIRQDGGNDYI